MNGNKINYVRSKKLRLWEQGTLFNFLRSLMKNTGAFNLMGVEMVYIGLGVHTSTNKYIIGFKFQPLSQNYGTQSLFRKGVIVMDN